MDTLRNLFGNATATILRLALVAGTIILISIFIVKPALETTEKADRAPATISANQSSTRTAFQQQIQQQIQQSVPNTVPQQQLPTQIQITRTIRGLTAQEAQQFSKCLQRARGRVPAINRCFRRFSRK